eukprot:TRINITY_DN4916_c0_g1_i1.p1 TRINITY_DN4916_c0_g1~~TRINITY_DN4916_c0_g1_i1.p1  ORF type:complete len:245 (-),score=46.90 TRINITY_DN4916_c0_g1_i1:88-822(-)
MMHTQKEAAFFFPTFVVFLLAFQPVHSAPSPPTFPSQFVATFSGVDPNGSYNGTWWWDYVNERDRNDYFRVEGGQAQSEISIDRYDMEQSEGPLQAYFYCAWLQVCNKEYLVPPMRPFSVPGTSVYKGIRVVDGVQCEHWTYTFTSQGHDWIADYDVGKRDGYYYPVKIEYSGNQPHVVVHWTSFEVMDDIPESIFAIPPTWDCTFGVEEHPSRSVTELVKRELVLGGVWEQVCPPSSSLTRIQ